MTQKPGWRPEHTLTAALLVFIGSLVIGIGVVAAAVMGGRLVEDVAPTGLAIAGAGVVAALAIGAYGRKLRRSQRPEWLETQAWQSGFKEKLEKEGKPGKTGEEGTHRG